MGGYVLVEKRWESITWQLSCSLAGSLPSLTPPQNTPRPQISPPVLTLLSPRLLLENHQFPRLSQQELSPKHCHHQNYSRQKSLPYFPKMLFCQAQIFLKSLWEVESAFVLHPDDSLAHPNRDRTPHSLTLWQCCSHGRRSRWQCLVVGRLGSTVRHVVETAAAALELCLAPHFRRLRPTHSTTIHSLSAYHATIPYHDALYISLSTHAPRHVHCTLHNTKHTNNRRHLPKICTDCIHQKFTSSIP